MTTNQITKFLQAAYEAYVNNQDYPAPKWHNADIDGMAYSLDENSFEFVVDGKTYAVVITERTTP